MKRMLMVLTTVCATALIGTMAIFPDAMGFHSKNTENQDRCNKWFLKAVKDYKLEGFLPPGIKTLVKECMDDGFESPWDLPPDEMEDPPRILTGLKVDFVTSEMSIPLTSQIFETKFSPCPPGKIIIDQPDIDMDVNAQVSLEIMQDRTTIMMRSFNADTKIGTLLAITPCLGLIDG